MAPDTTVQSPLYARLALAGIHDPDALGTRVVCEIAGAGAGIVLGWWLFSHRSSQRPAVNEGE